MRAGLIAPGAVVLAPNAPPEGGTASTTGTHNPEGCRRQPAGDAPPETGEQP